MASQLIERARAATTELRDAARLGREIYFHQRDPLVLAIHAALDALEAAETEIERLRAAAAPASPRPKIICLCGSTRFIETFAIKTWELEREGFIVLGCTLLPLSYCKVTSHFGEATGTKEQCDALHLRKIDLANEVLVLNVDGYIGESTRNEITYAEQYGKPVKYLEVVAAPASPHQEPKE